MSEQKFAEGIRVFNKHEKAPDFVIGSLVITLNELINFCKDNPGLLSDYKGEKQLKLQLQKSKNGNLVAVIDTYKKDSKNDMQF